MIFFSLILFTLGAYHFLLLCSRKFGQNFYRLQENRISYLQEGLTQEFLFVEPKRIRQLKNLILVFFLILSFLFQSLYSAIFGVILLWILPPFLLRILQKRRQKIFEEQLIQILPTLSSTLRAGHTFERALSTLAQSQKPPLSQEFSLIIKELHLGIPLMDSLHKLRLRFPSRDLETLVQAVMLSQQTGSNLAGVVDQVTSVIRERYRLKNHVNRLTAQGRAQAWVATAMPFLLILSLQIFSPGYLDPLFYSSGGKILMMGCCISLCLGGLWIHQISQMDFFE